KQGEGRGKALFLDAFSGVSGDMFVSALLDLGAPLEALRDALSKLPVSGFRVARGSRSYSGISAASFDVEVDAGQPERTWSSIDAMLAAAPLDDRVRELARRIFLTLAEAEGRVHGIDPARVHFHEVGAVDAIADVVGAAALVSWIAPDEIVCSPLPLGHGTVRARHGVLPLPAPAALECLRGVPTYGVDLEAELVTPTGAAIVRTLASRFTRWPEIVPESTGFGSGSHDLRERPNLLRVVLGTPHRHDGELGTHVVVEANVDDMTGELAAHALARLIEAGALDAWAVPATGKKGRPCLVLSAICGVGAADVVRSTMLRETTTIGLRTYEATRVERPRRIETVQTVFGAIPVKVSGGAFGPELAKPEFEACAEAARLAGVPVREVIAEAAAVWRAQRVSPAGRDR
ncbi:MAG TPA: nickel pincer cofactor biosynthesis protein LarC, partial [Polyangiaceae bacterium]|nr:nickel pincer cofactor biosynthesis protein LarC [Polyangiaceae bacterium]